MQKIPRLAKSRDILTECSSTPLPAARDDISPEAAGIQKETFKSPCNALDLPPEVLPIPLVARALSPPTAFSAPNFRCTGPDAGPRRGFLCNAPPPLPSPSLEALVTPPEPVAAAGYSHSTTPKVLGRMCVYCLSYIEPQRSTNSRTKRPYPDRKLVYLASHPPAHPSFQKQTAVQSQASSATNRSSEQTAPHQPSEPFSYFCLKSFRGYLAASYTFRGSRQKST